MPPDPQPWCPSDTVIFIGLSNDQKDSFRCQLDPYRLNDQNDNHNEYHNRCSTGYSKVLPRKILGPPDPLVQIAPWEILFAPTRPKSEINFAPLATRGGGRTLCLTQKFERFWKLDQKWDLIVPPPDISLRLFGPAIRRVLCNQLSLKGQSVRAMDL